MSIIPGIPDTAWDGCFDYDPSDYKDVDRQYWNNLFYRAPPEVRLLMGKRKAYWARQRSMRRLRMRMEAFERS